VWSGERTSAAFASGIVHPAPHPTTSRSTVSTHASRAARYALIADGLAGSRSHVSHAFSKEPRPSRSAASAVSRWVPGALLDMVALADATSDQLRAGLEPIVVAYREWLDVQQDRAAALPPHLRDDAAELVQEARQVADQLAVGLDHLLSDAEALRCFLPPQAWTPVGCQNAAHVADQR
jgi:hypothetical protein